METFFYMYGHDSVSGISIHTNILLAMIISCVLWVSISLVFEVWYSHILYIFMVRCIQLPVQKNIPSSDYISLAVCVGYFNLVRKTVYRNSLKKQKPWTPKEKPDCNDTDPGINTYICIYIYMMMMITNRQHHCYKKTYYTELRAVDHNIYPMNIIPFQLSPGPWLINMALRSCNNMILIRIPYHIVKVIFLATNILDIDPALFCLLDVELRFICLY